MDVCVRCAQGRCSAAGGAGPQFVSEIYYGTADTTHGNVGDSWHVVMCLSGSCLLPPFLPLLLVFLLEMSDGTALLDELVDAANTRARVKSSSSSVSYVHVRARDGC